MMIHLRIVAGGRLSDQALTLLDRSEAVCNVVAVPGVAHKPPGDLILCDVAREAASIVISDLVELGIPETGSISITPVETQISQAAERADRVAPGDPSNAVVWEEVTALTTESSVLTISYMLFMALATIIATVGIIEDSPILIVGAMILGPEFGPIAGLCVAFASGRLDKARRSAVALLIGFPVGITAAFAAALIFKWSGIAPGEFSAGGHFLSNLIASPNWLSAVVASCAGIAGVLSLTSSKSSALLGVLVSVTTIPAAANIAISAAYGDWDTWVGSQAQLAVNLACLIGAGVATLLFQRRIYVRRRRVHLSEMARSGGES